MIETSALRARLGFCPDDTTFPGAAALASMFAILPLLQALPSDTDRTAALAFCPAVWLLARQGSTPAGKAERTDQRLLVFAGILAVAAAIFSRQPAANLVITCTWIWTVAVGVASRRLAASAPAIRLVMTGLVIGCCIGLLWTRLSLIRGSATFPLYGHARIFGLHMLAGAGASLALLVAAPPKKISGFLILPAAVVAWSGLLWSGSRGPAVGIATGIGLWLWFGSTAERRRLLIWTPVLALAGLLGSYCLGIQSYSLGWQRAIASTVNVTGFQGLSSERNLIWSQTLREISHSPWFGQGADSYRFIQPVPVGDQPHNFILQWVLAFGVPAALALVVLLGRRTLRGLRGSSSAGPDELITWRRAAAACLLAATMGGLFDGVFYHAVSFIPVALLAGLAGGQPASPQAVVSSSSFAWRRAGQATCIAAALVVAVHAWLFFNLLAPPPASPRSDAARVLRAFPSATYGFWRWIDAWTPSVPVQERLDWLKWAQNHSPQPAVFYYQEAQCNIEKRDLNAAKNALARAIESSNGSTRNHYAELLRLTEEAISLRDGK